MNRWVPPIEVASASLLCCCHLRLILFLIALLLKWIDSFWKELLCLALEYILVNDRDVLGEIYSVKKDVIGGEI